MKSVWVASTLKIQLVFDFQRSNLTQIALRAGREPDQNYRDYFKVLRKESLSITDLGYFRLDTLKEIMYAYKSFFLSRLFPRTGLLTPEGKSIDLLKLLQRVPDKSFEMNVLLGKQKKHRLPCRLIVQAVPQKVADERRRKAKEKAKRKGSKVSKRTLALLSWTCLVTNVPVDMLSASQIVSFYRVRWQVELVFKLWKSYCGLARVAAFRRERIIVELYAKMIGILLTRFLTVHLQVSSDIEHIREVSSFKIRKICQRFARDLNRNLRTLSSLQSTLADLSVHIERFGFMEKRKTEPNVCRSLFLASTPVISPTMENNFT